jgi:RHS repeat-associated protein
VFFDKLTIQHGRGPLVEETHYYPFGLTMAGISSKGAGKLENRFKYNGIEQNTDLGLNQYDALYRNLDPQLGRWWQIDPKPSENISPYSAMENNPVLKFDVLGDTAWKPTNSWNDKMIDKFQNYVLNKVKDFINNGKEYTCEDFALSTLMDFASENGLPVSIKNGSGTLSSNSDDFDNASEFKNAVLKNTGAKDLQRPENTVAADSKNLLPGDVLVLRNSEGQGHHVQVVTSTSKNTVNIAQGNSGIANKIPGSSYVFGAGNPRSPFYTGTHVETGTYILSNGTYARTTYRGNMQMTGSGEWAPTVSNRVPVQQSSQSTSSFNLGYYKWNFKNFK